MKIGTGNFSPGGPSPKDSLKQRRQRIKDFFTNGIPEIAFPANFPSRLLEDLSPDNLENLQEDFELYIQAKLREVETFMEHSGDGISQENLELAENLIIAIKKFEAEHDYEKLFDFVNKDLNRSFQMLESISAHFPYFAEKYSGHEEEDYDNEEGFLKEIKFILSFKDHLSDLDNDAVFDLGGRIAGLAMFSMKLGMAVDIGRKEGLIEETPKDVQGATRILNYALGMMSRTLPIYFGFKTFRERENVDKLKVEWEACRSKLSKFPPGQIPEILLKAAPSELNEDEISANFENYTHSRLGEIFSESAFSEPSQENIDVANQMMDAIQMVSEGKYLAMLEITRNDLKESNRALQQFNGALTNIQLENTNEIFLPKLQRVISRITEPQRLSVEDCVDIESNLKYVMSFFSDLLEGDTDTPHYVQTKDTALGESEPWQQKEKPKYGGVAKNIIKSIYIRLRSVAWVLPLYLFFKNIEDKKESNKT